MAQAATAAEGGSARPIAVSTTPRPRGAWFKNGASTPGLSSGPGLAGRHHGDGHGAVMPDTSAHGRAEPAATDLPTGRAMRLSEEQSIGTPEDAPGIRLRR